MKISFLPLTAFLLLYFFGLNNLFAQTVVIEKTTRGGGRNGKYNYTNTNWKKNNTLCVITCTGSGNEICPDMCAGQTVGQHSYYQILIQQAQQMILSGQLSGTLYNTDINAYVTWTATLNESEGYDTDFLVYQN